MSCYPNDDNIDTFWMLLPSEFAIFFPFWDLPIYILREVMSHIESILQLLLASAQLHRVPFHASLCLLSIEPDGPQTIYRPGSCVLDQCKRFINLSQWMTFSAKWKEEDYAGAIR